MKNCKHFTRLKQQIVLRKLFSLSPTNSPPLPRDQIKFHCVSETNIFLRRCTEIYRHCYQSASIMQFLDVKKWCTANAFSDTKQKHVSGKICKVRKAFDSVVGAYFFNGR